MRTAFDWDGSLRRPREWTTAPKGAEERVLAPALTSRVSGVTCRRFCRKVWRPGFCAPRGRVLRPGCENRCVLRSYSATIHPPDDDPADDGPGDERDDDEDLGHLRPRRSNHHSAPQMSRITVNVTRARSVISLTSSTRSPRRSSSARTRRARSARSGGSWRWLSGWVWKHRLDSHP